MFSVQCSVQAFQCFTLRRVGVQCSVQACVHSCAHFGVRRTVQAWQAELCRAVPDFVHVQYAPQLASRLYQVTSQLGCAEP